MSEKHKQAVCIALGAVLFTIMLFAYPQTEVSKFCYKLLIAMCLFCLATRDLGYVALWLQTAARFVVKVVVK